MTPIDPIVAKAEAILREMAGELTGPLEDECVCCYVARMLEQFGCNGTHRLAERYRDAVAPRVKALKTRMQRLGACCCDCELFMNGYAPIDGWPDERSEEEAFGGYWLDDELPPCEGVRRGSFEPCTNWVRIGRW